MEPDALLWQDIDPKKTVEEKMRAAIKRYQEKRGRTPTECWVNAREDTPPEIDGVRVIKKHYVLPHHFQVGVSA